jgi:hypothetical protein
MPKTKEDRRSSRRKDHDEPYRNQGRGYRDGDRHYSHRTGRPKIDDGGPRRGSRNDSHMPDDDDELAPCSSFDAMKLKPDLLKGIYAYGFEKPSAIQQRFVQHYIIIERRSLCFEVQLLFDEEGSPLFFFLLHWSERFAL